MKVLSLFDGISCGMVALERSGIPVESYYASEIEKNAIAISQKNYPKIVRLGDVNGWKNWKIPWDEIDLIIAGSPCQSLSITRGEIRQGLNGKSKLFFVFVDILNFVKSTNPNVWFLFENVASMSHDNYITISQMLGDSGCLINSRHFSAQERSRIYWTNIPINHIPHNNTVLKDILLPESEIPDKYYYSAPLLNIDMTKQVCATLQIKINEMHKRVFNPNYKCHTLTCVTGGHQQKKVLVDGRCRKLTPIEYERLQTLPDNYTAGVADSARYTACGNGWTVDVIAHILRGINA